MKLSDYKNEDALDLLADIIDPVSEIMTDKELQKAVKGQNKLGVVKAIIKSHKTEILQILATLDGVPVEEYECNVFTLPVRIMELVNDKELASFFTSQEWTEEKTASIVPMENTEASEQ